MKQLMLAELLITSRTANDISRGSYNIAKVRMTLAGAHGIMTTAAYLQAGWISARRDRRRVRLADDFNAEELSILAKVMGVTQEVSRIVMFPSWLAHPHATDNKPSTACARSLRSEDTSPNAWDYPSCGCCSRRSPGSFQWQVERRSQGECPNGMGGGRHGTCVGPPGRRR